jgi:hypothetical protein
VDLPVEYKSERIVEVVAELTRRFGKDAFEVIDYWPDDHHTIGIARPGADEPCVCISVAGAAAGRFHLERDGECVHNCLIQGVVWVTKQQLARRRPSVRQVRPVRRRPSYKSDAG